MSWHKTHRTTSVYPAVFVSLFGMVGLNAYAMNLGQANIKSAQHEPLSATINVTNIDAANFHASVASRDIYRQMGLNPDDEISVTFTPTSKSAGQIVITSNKPISKPFTDVVLNLNNNGEQIIEPQTLLMPISAGSAVALPADKSSPIPITDTKQNLPKVGPMLNGYGVAGNAQESTPTQVLGQGVPTPATGNVVSREGKVLSKLTPEGTNQQVNILTQEVVRRAYAAGQAPVSPTLPSDPAQEPRPARTEPTKSAAAGDSVYVVQQGDSLWSIADAIAKANNLRVSDVMIAIHKANPDAFNKGKVDQLKVDANLNIPRYQVVLSQQAISETIQAKRSSDKANNVTAKKTTAKQPSKPTAKTHTSTSSNSQTTTVKTTQKALPKAQMTLVTPTQQGSAIGTNNKAVPNAVAGGDGNLAGTLKSTRQQTASQAKRVYDLNQELSSAAKKVQLQNQKLAELENRLRSLQENKQ